MKFLGHPVHIMLIHFPSALFPMDFVCSLLALYSGVSSFADASLYAMTGGVGLGILAVITGTIDLANQVKEKPNAVTKIILHGGINLSVLMGYIVLAYIAYQHYPHLQADSLPKLIFKGSLVTFLIVGNYLGGNLVLKEKIGVEK